MAVLFKEDQITSLTYQAMSRFSAELYNHKFGVFIPKYLTTHLLNKLDSNK